MYSEVIGLRMVAITSTRRLELHHHFQTYNQFLVLSAMNLPETRKYLTITDAQSSANLAFTTTISGLFGIGAVLLFF